MIVVEGALTEQKLQYNQGHLSKSCHIPLKQEYKLQIPTGCLIKGPTGHLEMGFEGQNLPNFAKFK